LTERHQSEVKMWMRTTVVPVTVVVDALMEPPVNLTKGPIYELTRAREAQEEAGASVPSFPTHHKSFRTQYVF
jgi:hypothetical protein